MPARELLLKDYADACIVACQRCVRALRGDPLAVYTAPPANSRQLKCDRYSAEGHPCLANPLPPLHQAAVFTAAANAAPVGPALRFWEGKLPLHRSCWDMADSDSCLAPPPRMLGYPRYCVDPGLACWALALETLFHTAKFILSLLLTIVHSLTSLPRHFIYNRQNNCFSLRYHYLLPIDRLQP